MEEALSPWIEVSDSLLRTHVDSAEKILDAATFRAALIQALSEASGPNRFGSPMTD